MPSAVWLFRGLSGSVRLECWVTSGSEGDADGQGEALKAWPGHFHFILWAMGPAQTDWCYTWSL